MSEKQAYLQLITSLGQSYIERGFVSSQKGQMLKKKSKDNELGLQIRFQPTILDNSSDIQVHCYFSVQSDKLKQWRFSKYKSKDNAIATVLYVSVIDLFPLNETISKWILNSVNKGELYVQMKELLCQYLDPILLVFEETSFAIELILENGWRLTDHINVQQLAFPIDFLLCFTEKKAVEKAFNLYLQREGLVLEAKRVYREMQSSKYRGFIESSKIEIKVFQIAFLNGLNIYN